MTEIKERAFLKAKEQQEIWERFTEATEKRWHPFHQLATATKISRERVKGILMAVGLSRNEAERTLKKILADNGSYYKWWVKVTPQYVYLLDGELRRQIREARIKEGGIEALLAKLGFSERRKAVKEEFEELKKIAEKYPDLNSAKDCREAKNKLLYEASEPTDELDDEGFPIRYIRQELSAETFAKIKEIVKLEKYFAWGAET